MRQTAITFVRNFTKMLTDFQIFFTSELSSKFIIKLYLSIPQHLTDVATLPCETVMSENSDNLKYITVATTNHKVWWFCFNTELF